MDDSVLWATALWSGVLGLLLLAVAGVVAVYLNTRARKARDVDSADTSQSHARDAAPADRTRPPAGSSNAQRATVRSPWTWVKAWFFAFVHAGTVSLVLGGITFFEDLAKASDEIQRTGAVTFPKQLLPGTLSGPTSLRRLSQPSGDLSRSDDHRSDDLRHEATGADVEGEGLEQPGAPPPDAVGWEVVGLVNEVSAGGE